MAVVPKKYFVVEAAYYPKDDTWTSSIKTYTTLQDAEIQYHTRMGALMGSAQAQKALLYVISSNGNKIHGDSVDTKYVEPEPEPEPTPEPEGE